MSVHFIGAGPGAPDLITVRGLRLIQRCPVCLYAGSLVPEEIVKAAPQGARVVTMVIPVAKAPKADRNCPESTAIKAADDSG